MINYGIENRRTFEPTVQYTRGVSKASHSDITGDFSLHKDNNYLLYTHTNIQEIFHAQPSLSENNERIYYFRSFTQIIFNRYKP